MKKSSWMLLAVLLALAGCAVVLANYPVTQPPATVTADPPTITPSVTPPASPIETALPPTATIPPTARPTATPQPPTPTARPAVTAAPPTATPAPSTLTPAPLLPATGDAAPPVPLDLQAFLQLAASGGLGWLIGAALAYAFEEWAWFKDKLTAEQKRWLSIGLSLGVPILAQALLLNVPDAVFARLNPYFAALVTALAGLFGNKREYRGVIKPQQRDWLGIEESIRESDTVVLGDEA